MPLRLPPVTLYLLIANIALFLLQQVAGDWFTAHLALWPLGPDRLAQAANGAVVSVGFRPWQLLSYAFLHEGFEHIFFNMFALYMFGGTIERAFGARHFALYYLVCLLTAGVAQLLVTSYWTHAYGPTIGASGAVFGLLLAFGMLFPQERLTLMFLPIPIPAWLFVLGYGLVELVLGVAGWQRDVAHFAHLGGMLGGFVLLQYWRGKLPIKPRWRLMR